MTRQEQIKQQAKLLCNTVSPDEYFIKGAEWADEHPSEQTLTKTVYLYKRWFYNDSGLNVMEFIKKNWNIKI